MISAEKTSRFALATVSHILITNYVHSVLLGDLQITPSQYFRARTSRTYILLPHAADQTKHSNIF